MTKNDETEFKKKRAKRNIGILIGLIAFVAIIYSVAIIKMSNY